MKKYSAVTFLVTGLVAGFAASAAEGDPLTVVQRMIAAENAGNLEAVLALWDDDGTIVNTRGRRIKGKEAIRNFTSTNISRGNQHTLESPTVAGDSVSWLHTDDTDFYRRLGVAPVNIVSRATVRDGRIVAYIGYFPHPEINRIGRACDAPQATGILLFGQPCTEFIRAVRAHTDQVLAVRH